MTKLLSLILVSTVSTLGTDARENWERKELTCGTLSLIKSNCRQRLTVYFVPRNSVIDVRWSVAISKGGKNWKRVNDTGIYKFHNGSGYYLTYKFRKEDGDTVDILPTLTPSQYCEGSDSNPFRVHLNHSSDNKDCTSDHRDTAKTDQGIQTDVQKNTRIFRTGEADVTSERQQHLTTRIKSETDKSLTEDKHSSENKSTKDSNAEQGNESFLLSLVLAVTGSILLLIVIVIAIIVYRKKTGNKPNKENVVDELHSVAGDGVLNTPDVTYAQIDKARKTIKSATAVTQYEHGVVKQAGDLQVSALVQPSEAVAPSETKQQKKMEQSAIIATQPQCSLDIEGNADLIYVQLDTDHLNKSVTLRPNPAKASNVADEQDTVAYVGIDFAKSTNVGTEKE